MTQCFYIWFNKVLLFRNISTYKRAITTSAYTKRNIDIKKEGKLQKVSKYKLADSYAKAWVEASFSLKKQEDVYKEVLLLRQSLENDADLWQKIMI